MLIDVTYKKESNAYTNREVITELDWDTIRIYFLTTVITQCCKKKTHL
jgi:hypothetical protein